MSSTNFTWSILECLDPYQLCLPQYTNICVFLTRFCEFNTYIVAFLILQKEGKIKTLKEMALTVNGNFFRFVWSFCLWDLLQNLTMMKKLFLGQFFLLTAKMYSKSIQSAFKGWKFSIYYSSFLLEAEIMTSE